MASVIEPVVDLSTLSLYKLKTNPIHSLESQNQRRKEVLKKQKEKREQQISQLRFLNLNESQSTDESEQQPQKPQWPPRKSRRNPSTICPIGMMLAEWLFSPPEDISSWFVLPCPRGHRCLVVVQSHRTQVFGKNGNPIRTIHTNLPRQTILYCIYDNRTSVYHIIDILMWNGQDYSTQIECQCRFYVLLSLNGDSKWRTQFVIFPRIPFEKQHQWPQAQDGYLFYHPLGFYEEGYSPLVCWLQPFMIKEILGIELNYSIEKPSGYTNAQDYMIEEQSNRKEQQKSSRKKKDKFSHDEEQENVMSVDQ